MHKVAYELIQVRQGVFHDHGANIKITYSIHFKDLRLVVLLLGVARSSLGLKKLSRKKWSRS